MGLIKADPQEVAKMSRELAMQARTGNLGGNGMTDFGPVDWLREGRSGPTSTKEG